MLKSGSMWRQRGHIEWKSYSNVSIRNDYGLVTFPSSLKLWKSKFVFVSGFPGDQHPFLARFPVCRSFIRHHLPKATTELLKYTEKLLADCRPNPPSAYDNCTKVNLGKAGFLVSLDRQYELAEIEDEQMHPSDPEEESDAESPSEDGNDEEAGDPRLSPRLERKRRGGDSQSLSGAQEFHESTVVTIPSPTKALDHAQKRRRVIGAKDEEEGPSSDSLRSDAVLAMRLPKSKGRKSSLHSTSCGEGAKFVSGANFLASIETELGRLKKLLEAHHEQVSELQLQAVSKFEEVVKLQGLLKEAEESMPQLISLMASLELKLHQSDGRRAELDIELVEAISHPE
ncbi:unnamed protein product [Cuscuta campestris]|uniref:Uncharacterized protein n=1 Tax=Cuscuta campestris TaxID=132261 RepID=A0A484NRP1_9ASTE|nr:unnamed protein product [Cuscuta campestris]